MHARGELLRLRGIPGRGEQHATRAKLPACRDRCGGRVPWWFDTRGYEVYLDGVKVAFTTDKATITGLAPDSRHRVKIVTRDVRGFSSPPSQGLVFATPPTDR